LNVLAYLVGENQSRATAVSLTMNEDDWSWSMAAYLWFVHAATVHQWKGVHILYELHNLWIVI